MEEIARNISSFDESKAGHAALKKHVSDLKSDGMRARINSLGRDLPTLAALLDPFKNTIASAVILYVLLVILFICLFQISPALCVFSFRLLFFIF